MTAKLAVSGILLLKRILFQRRLTEDYLLEIEKKLHNAVSHLSGRSQIGAFTTCLTKPENATKD